MENAYILLAILLCLMYAFRVWYTSREGFEDGKTEEFHDKEIYDEKYAAIYDYLWNSTERIKFEQVSMQDICLAERQTDAVKVLDMCCGTANHASFFRDLGVQYVGVDTSDAMMAKGRERCPSAKFNKGDVTQTQLYAPKSFSHCLLLGFSIYMFQNPRVVCDNAHQWLQPDGVFVVHMVDPDKYDPLHDLASPFAAFSLQKYNRERQTESIVYFDEFKYSGKLVKKEGEDDASYDEVMSYYDPAQNNGNKYRENKLTLYMPSKERMIEIVKTSGFRHIETVDLLHSGKEYQYLVYFQR
jgi:ubiquinone/menaquinone biosynthesis C-methylase UbiE